MNNPPCQPATRALRESPGLAERHIGCHRREGGRPARLTPMRVARLRHELPAHGFRLRRPADRRLHVPFMKAECGLPDARLGALLSVVSITVALGTFSVAVPIGGTRLAYEMGPALLPKEAATASPASCRR